MELPEIIATNLKIYMVINKTYITRLSNQTGLSRPAITGLTTMKSKAIQIHTIAVLAKALNITPNKLFSEQLIKELEEKNVINR